MKFRSFAAIAAAGAFAAGGVLAASPGQAEPTRAEARKFVQATESMPVSKIQGDLKYWTKARMQKAIPMDLTQRGAAITGAAAPTASNGTVPQRRTPTTTGKLFFSNGGSDYVCSASTVRMAGVFPKDKSKAVTAAHCVTSGTDWHENFVYVPKYRNGNAPLGVWQATDARTYRKYRRTENYSFDHALLKIKPKAKQIAKVTGGNKLIFGASQRQRWTRIIGWPAEADNGKNYNGEVPVQCKGKTYRYPRSTDAAMRCPLTGGASGGPWFKRMSTKNRGVVYTVSSRRTITGPPILLATPFRKDFKAMLGSWYPAHQ